MTWKVNHGIQLQQNTISQLTVEQTFMSANEKAGSDVEQKKLSFIVIGMSTVVT